MASDQNTDGSSLAILPEIIEVDVSYPAMVVEDGDGSSIQNMDMITSFEYFNCQNAATVTEKQEDYDSESNGEEQQNTSGDFEDDVISKEREQELTNRFLNGELTFTEYAAMMEGNEVDESGTDSRYAVSSATVDAFEKELKVATKQTSRRNKGPREVTRRRRRRFLPPALLGLMGEANLRYARGDRETAIKMCLEIIRQVPTAPEPFQTLAVLYEELGFADKALQFALIAAHLSPHDPNQWIRLAISSEEQGNMKQAITCYSKAIIADPHNIETHMKRCSMLEDLGDRKSALRGYLKLLGILTPKEGPLVLQIAKSVAHKYHEEGELNKAREAMDIAFNKCSNLITSEDVNLMLELLLGLKDYNNCLKFLVQYCNIEVEAAPDNTENNEGEEPVLRIQSCNIPDSLAIDLQVKLIVVMVHLKAFHLLDGLLTLLLECQNPEQSGDLYLDVAEALMSEERYQDALRLLNPLVASKNYSLAAVWLRQADCLKACGNLEEAVSAYENVVSQAPQHLEARIILSTLLHELGRGELALAVLTQDAESEVLEPGLLYKRCLLLKESKNKTEEFLAVGQLLLSRHCTRIRNRHELDALTRLRRLGKKSEALTKVRVSRGEPDFDPDVPDFGEGKNEPSVEEEWQLFRDLCQTCYDTERFPLLQRLAFSALSSRKFHADSNRVRETEFLCLLSCLYNGDACYGYNFARDHLLRNMHCPRVWNFFNLVIQRADDVRHNRFLMRLLARSSEHKALTLLHANNCLVAGTYKYALSEYATLFRGSPCASLAFLIGVTLFQMACQKFSAKKHSLVTQGLSFLWQYQNLRGKMGKQESSYNLGRAFHQLGLLPAAIHHYKTCLEYTSPLIEEYPYILDLKREAAFNLHLIYLHSGARDIARSYIEKYVVV